MTPSDESDDSGSPAVCPTSLSQSPGQLCAKSLLLSVAAHPLARVGQRTSLSSSSINGIMGVMVGGNFVCMVADCLCTERAYVLDA